MKKVLIYFAMAVVLALGSTSCSDFLEIEPVGAVNETNLTDQEGINYLLTGMYSALNIPAATTNSYFGASLTNYTYGDVMGGDANKGSTAADQSDFTLLETFSFTTDNSYIKRKWVAVYDAVARANVMHLAGLIKDELSAIPGQEKDFYTEAIAQARFMRGFYLFEGIKNFGAAIPYVSLEDYESSVNPLISNVDESGNYIYIWEQVAEDLQYAYDNLPGAWPEEPGRANKWAAGAFLAKLRIFQSSPYNGTNGTSNKWTEAKSILETVIANGTDSKGTKYTLTPSYETLYTAGESDWTGESVFDVQMAISGTQYYTNAINGNSHISLSGKIGSGWGFYQPSYDLVNAHMVDENGLPYLDKSYQSKTSVTTIDGDNVPHTDLTVYTDPRVDVSAGRFNVPYMDWDIPVTIDGWIRDLANGGPFLNKKNLPKKADKGGLSLTTTGGSTAKNFHLMRVAELYLLYAEACIETGDINTAREYINKVRARAAQSCIMAADANNNMALTSSPYVLEDKVSGNTIANTAANYRIGLYPASGWTVDKAIKALRFERRIELAMEGHHWYDLVRWNAASEELGNKGSGFLAYEKRYLLKYQSATYPDRLVTLPIPNDEIVTMEDVLVQNENWK
jgi:hypothetical protein